MIEDDPDLDATDAAHPAWWRGQEHGTKMMCLMISFWVTGARREGTHYEDVENARRSVFKLFDDLTACEKAYEDLCEKYERDTGRPVWCTCNDNHECEGHRA